MVAYSLAGLVLFNTGLILIDLHLMKELSHLLFSLNVLVEVKELLSQIYHHVNLPDEHLVQLLHIHLDVAAGLVHLFEYLHFLLDNLDALLATGVVLEDQLLLVLQNLFNQLLVVLAEHVLVLSVLNFQLDKGWNAVSKLFSLLDGWRRLLGAHTELLCLEVLVRGLGSLTLQSRPRLLLVLLGWLS